MDDWLDDMDGAPRGLVHPAKGPLGRAVRALRHDMFLSQQQLADMANASQTAVSRLERGAPYWSLFCRIADAVGGLPVVTIERLKTERERMDELFGAEVAYGDRYDDLLYGDSGDSGDSASDDPPDAA